MATEPTSNKKKYVPGAQFGFTDVDKEKDTVYKMTDAVNKTGRFLADQAQQYKLTADNGSTKGWTADNVGDITKFFTGDRVGQFSLSAVDVARMTDKAGIPAAYQNTYFLAEFISAGPKDTMVTLSPRIPANDAISIVKIWYNCKTGIVSHTEFHSSDVQNEAKYQHPQLTRADSTAISLPAKTNWDTLNRTGYYHSANTGVNTPVGGGYFSLEVIATSGTSYITQRATQNNGDVYIRVYTSNKWTSWALQATTAYVDNKVKTAVDAGQSYPLTKSNGLYKYSFSETSNIETEFAKQSYNNGTVYITGGNPFIKSVMGGQSFFGYAHTLTMKDSGYLMGTTRPGRIWVNIMGDGYTWKGWKQLGTMDDITGSQNMLQNKINATTESQNMLQKKINATQVHKLTADNGTTTSVDNQDWNTLKSTGLYHCNPAGANAPLPKGNLILEVLSIDNNANIVQRATEMMSNRVFKRGLAWGKWSAWTELQTKTHETYRVPLNTSVVKNYDDDHPFELNYANGVVSFCNTFSPIKETPSGNDGFVVGTIADVRYRPTQVIRTLCQGSWDHVFLLSVGIDGVITASRNRSKTVYNLTFDAGEWCNASSSYTTNDTHA